MPLIRNCSSCGRSNRIPAKHLSDVGKCGACKAELPAIGEPIEVQVLVENATSVKLENRSFPVRRTSRSRLREVDFQLEEHELRGLEQNPETASRWHNSHAKGRSYAVSTAAPIHRCRNRWRGKLLRQTSIAQCRQELVTGR
jgi:hypothetical protein